MATKIDSIVVTCLKCGEEYTTWMGVGLEELGPDPCGVATADFSRPSIFKVVNRMMGFL